MEWSHMAWRDAEGECNPVLQACQVGRRENQDPAREKCLAAATQETERIKQMFY